MYGTGVWHQSFRPGGFWYYNRLVYPESFEQQLEVKDLNLRQAITNTDVFIIMVTEANLPKFPWGFVKNTLAAFSPDYDTTYLEKKAEEADYQKELQNHIFVIRNNENWMKTIREKAKKQGISVDSMVVRDAMWIMEQKKQNSNLN
jgi:glutaredoxin